MYIYITTVSREFIGRALSAPQRSRLARPITVGRQFLRRRRASEFPSLAFLFRSDNVLPIPVRANYTSIWKGRALKSLFVVTPLPPPRSGTIRTGTLGAIRFVTFRNDFRVPRTAVHTATTPGIPSGRAGVRHASLTKSEIERGNCWEGVLVKVYGRKRRRTRRKTGFRRSLPRARRSFTSR